MYSYFCNTSRHGPRTTGCEHNHRRDRRYISRCLRRVVREGNAASRAFDDASGRQRSTVDRHGVRAEIDATADTLGFTNGVALFVGEAVGDVNEATLRRIQIREAIKAHFSVYSVGPIVCINVIDPAKSAHKATATAQNHQLVDGQVQLQVYGGPDEPLLGVIESTVVIKELPPGTTTESLTASIEDAVAKGKLKVKAINDFTSESVEIEIKAPAGVTSQQLTDALFAFTNCEVTIISV